MWTWEKCLDGTGIVGTEDFTWVWILLRWHWRQALAHTPTSWDIPGQTNRSEINLRDPLTPGWDTLCRARNKGLRRTYGTRCLRIPVELSHNKSPKSRVTVTIEREDKFFIAVNDGQTLKKSLKNQSLELKNLVGLWSKVWNLTPPTPQTPPTPLTPPEQDPW